MKRVALLCVGILLQWAWASAQTPADTLTADSAATVRVYLPEALYDLALMDSAVWQERFSGGYFGIYSPLQYDWSARPMRMHPALGSRMLVRNRQSDGYFLLLLGVLLSLAVLINRNQQYARNMLMALFNLRLALQFAREQAANRTLVSLLYLGMFNLLFALYLSEWLAGRLPVSSGARLSGIVALLFLSITLLYLGKYYFYKLLGLLFGLRDQVSFYLTEVFLINRVQAFLMLPVLAALYFMPFSNVEEVRAMTLVLFALGMLWRYINAIRYVRTVVTTHVFHFILYFCAVELIPTAVIAKFLLHV